MKLSEFCLFSIIFLLILFFSCFIFSLNDKHLDIMFIVV